MRMAYFLFTVCAVLAVLAPLAHARPGRGLLREASNGRTLLNFSSDDAKPAEAEVAKLSLDGKTGTKGVSQHEKVDEAVHLNAGDVQSESENTQEAEEDEVLCTEMGTCYEKRLLTATIDYKNDGPNNPITDPPH